MKEAYYQSDNIESLSDRWLANYGNPSKAKRQSLDLGTAALLVLDMQEYFLEDGSHAFIPSAPPIIPRLDRAVKVFRAAKRPLLATRHANSQQDAAMMASWWSELLTEDHPLGKLHPALDVHEDEILLKSQYDAFYHSDLEARLLAMGIRQLVIGGVMTHLCCETTARSAFVHGFEVFFLIDGTATYTADLHTASLRSLAHGFAVLTTTGYLFGKV
jgi:bifunctional isochorismate lyase/aryl carrier protein